MNIRRLNQAGIEALNRFLDSADSQPELNPPQSLLQSEESSEPLPVEIAIEHRVFENRFDAGKYLFELLAPHQIPNVERDVNLWAWLALFFADQLFSFEKGKRRCGARARWLLEPANWTRYYRHLLAGPFRIYAAHARNPQLARIVLTTPVNKPGDAVEQIASRQDLISNPVFLTLATRLYYDDAKGKLKTGAGSKNRGSSRRLTEVLNQFDLTWDLFETPVDHLSVLLPDEFDRFKR